MRTILTLFILGITLLSCQKEFEYVGEGKQPLLVLDGIIEINKVPKIYLSRSIFFLSNNNNTPSTAIGDANVVLTNLDLNVSYTLTALTGQVGFYEGSVPVEPNTRYKIDITHPKYPSISSEIRTVNNLTQFNYDTSSVSSGSVVNHKLSLLMNNENGRNFYALKVGVKAEEINYDNDSTFLFVDTVTISSVFIQTNNTYQGFYDFGLYFFNDDLFQSSSIIFPVTYSNNTNGPVSGSWPQFGFVTNRIIGWSVELSLMNKECYDYFSSIQNNSFVSPFDDPANVVSNVSNGLGIFGSVSKLIMEK